MTRCVPIQKDSSNDADLSFRRGIEAFQQKRFAQAFDEFTAAEDSSYSEIERRAYLGYIAFALKGRRTHLSIEEGLHLLSRAVQENEQSTRPSKTPWILLARACEERGYPLQARAHLRVAANFYPGDPQIIADLQRLGGDEEASPQHTPSPSPALLLSAETPQKQRPPLSPAFRRGALRAGLILGFIGSVIAFFNLRSPSAPQQENFADAYAHVLPMSSFHHAEGGWVGRIEPSAEVGKPFTKQDIASGCRELARSVKLAPNQIITLFFDGGREVVNCTP